MINQIGLLFETGKNINDIIIIFLYLDLDFTAVQQLNEATQTFFKLRGDNVEPTATLWVMPVRIHLNFKFEGY